MQIPQTIRDRMRKAPAGEKSRSVGIEIARAALRECKTLPRVKGAYIMPPFGRYDTALRIIEGVI